MADAPASSQIRDRISGPLTRILRLYVALITALVMGLTVLATYSYQRAELEHQREQVTTRLVAEVTNQASELTALASSPLLWTGLIDSQGREAYLEPLMERFNRGAVRKF